MSGRTLPDLSLPAHTGEDVPLLTGAESGGVLLVFVPYAFTPVCADELVTLVGLAGRLRARGIAPLVVSCDTKYTLRAWAIAELGDAWDSVPLLSDFWPHGALSRACDVFDHRRGGPHRTALLADSSGSVVDEETADFGTPRDLGRFVR
ncbi:redoxin domain-containing protein [Brevibacterium yomogidense]|uniref:Alkyl hydroperoxide reductase subunit C-like protein n=1 Tax=Brevibacterium yomogidense TaxID=946573 RepID=A0A1X6X9Z7_9MICO|nr:redoxin domain-containing protein [Brevibacterium yomogidense]SLM96028.1 Alkyl hydroperoxide reductase subunit C-like protein [Brevibacterium yomogidense]